MMVVYRTTGPWGAGKGSNLTPAEVDGNFHELEQAIANALSGIASPTALADITYEDGTVTFVLTDNTTRGPFDLPLAVFRWRGRYVAATTYEEMDCLFHPAIGGYLVLQPHVAPSTFNPDLTIGGQPVYRLMFQLFPGGFQPVTNIAGGTYTLQEEDAGAFLRFTSSPGADVTVPTNGAVAFAIGTEVTLRAGGAATVDIVAASGVTINRPGGAAGIPEDGGVAYLKKVNTNEWDLWLAGEGVPAPTESELPTEAGTSEEPATSEPGTATEPPSSSEGSEPGNFFAEATGDGRIGYEDGWPIGFLANPINGLPVRALYINTDFPDYMLLDLDGTTEYPEYIEVAIVGLGSVVVGPGDVSGSITRYVSFDGALNLEADTWYNLTLTEAPTP